MKCPKCQAELPEHAVECAVCCCPIDPKDADRAEGSGDGREEDIFKPFSGFRRTLSTEFMEREIRTRMLEECHELLQVRTYEPGEAIIRQGEKNRDLIFVIEGSIEISTEGEGEEVMLSRVQEPYILGDIGFLSGFPRTATVIAGTRVKGFVMKYEHYTTLFPQPPDWLIPLLTAFVSGIKSLHFENAQLKKEIKSRQP